MVINHSLLTYIKFIFRTQLRNPQLTFKIVVIFNTTSTELSFDYIENDHNFERTEDRATVF